MSKSNTSKNSITHGFYATDVVLPWENQQEFDDLLRRYWDEYCPDGVSEEAAVSELTSLHWKKRRLEAGLQQALQKLRDYATVVETNDPLVIWLASRRSRKLQPRGVSAIVRTLEQTSRSKSVSPINRMPTQLLNLVS